MLDHPILAYPVSTESGNSDPSARNAAPKEQPRSWYALYTISNQEKRAQQLLRAKGVEIFLPLYAVTKRWKNRMTVKLELPLFTGYLFARIALSERIRVLEVPAVVSIVGNGRELLPLPDSEIDALRTGLSVREVNPYPYLKTGNRIRIRSGPLAGLEGVVVRKDDQLRVVVNVDAILQSFAVHVHAEELEACP